ncbi:hypothetical protein BOTBODRAFT_34694 [Botryobasidium botryosum FD-172 SS1]|uniref:Small nuclear ribonucleoprotein Prp3 C-terminal domain-containing protein n=1 Tax=Botryobasidium botryosum (strain FD-172 SS1) TaxID=930990 RepID=A0A067MA21_BOTB1|nr:hypothetical protein BOTBODRAFT_34694 [Botryobasidium botryosum FD-172 SS1]
MVSDEIRLRQLDELLLIRSSILPDELFQLITPSWEAFLDASSSGDSLPLPFPLESPRFKVGTQAVWFDVTLPDQARQAAIFTGGDSVGREEAEQWSALINNKMEETSQAPEDFPAYQLLSAHLLPMIQSSAEKSKDDARSRLSEHEMLGAQAQDTACYHALLSSHHLISPEKRRSLSSWSRSLHLSGFAKVSYPGVIYVEGGRGSKASIEEFVKRVKGMQWLALKVRFVEEVEVGLVIGKGWKEVEKVGEVVEEMRKRGRERHVTGLGLGSSKSIDNKEK